MADKKVALKDASAKEAKAKDAALEAAVTQIERDFGQGALMRLGADATIAYGHTDLRDAILELTDQRGADVVFDPVGGAHSERALRATAWRGRLLVIGFADGQYSEHNYHWRDVLTHIHESHAISVGYEGWHGDDLALFAPSYAQPTFQYNNMIDLINDKPYSESNLSYNPITGKPMPGQYEYAESTFGIFAQDTWRATHRLTVNYGLRYDNFGNPYPIAGTPLADAAPIAPIEFVRIIALARVMMPKSFVRLSAGRSAMSDEMQALCFFAGANSIFVGDTLLTAGNPEDAADRKLFDRLGLEAI